MIQSIDVYDFVFINTTKPKITVKKLRCQLEGLKEVLSKRGAIAVKTTIKEYAEIKGILDELMGKESYLETFFLGKKSRVISQIDKWSHLQSSIEILLVYRASSEFYYRNPCISDVKKKDHWISLRTQKNPAPQYLIEGIFPYHGGWKWDEERAFRALLNYKCFLLNNGDLELEDYWINMKEEYEKQNGFPLEFLRQRKNNLQYWVPPQAQKVINTNLTNTCVLGLNKEKDIQSIEFILKIFTDKQSRVLDVSAGEGIVGQALMKLNQEDNGNRVFTLITSSKSCYFTLKQQTSVKQIILN